ncbi:hypothetical protein ED28_12665 [[Pantoea] beijingensis]|uniref:Uncharacterized protein n=2 Tax=[Pantoea] beijingensis TaxID=1324864 RepID=A0A443ICG9_9GAMM|nr:hypothetical protein ED28_12665 [[Pantoea] beijingensis]
MVGVTMIRLHVSLLYGVSVMNGIGAQYSQPARDLSHEQSVIGDEAGRTNNQHSTRSVSTTQSVTGKGQENIDAISKLLRNYFTGGEDMHELVNSRATELDSMGYKPDSIRAVLDKGEKLDTWTAALSNTIATVSFAVSGFPGAALGKAIGDARHAVPGSMAADVINGLSGGGMAMVLKAFSDKVLSKALKDATWMDADKEHLVPEMQTLVSRREGYAYNLKHAVIGGLGFDARNVVNGLAAVGAAATLSDAGLQKVNTAMGTLLTPAAGALSAVLSHKKNSLNGPEFLLGRNDWRERFVELDNTSVSDQMLSGGKKRLLSALQSLVSPRELAKGIVNPLSGNMVAEIMTLGAGLGGVNALRNLTRQGMEGSTMSAAAKQTVEQAVNILSAAAAYAAQGIAGTIAGPAPGHNDQAIDSFFNNHPLLEPKNWLGSGTEASGDTASEASLSPDINQPESSSETSVQQGSGNISLRNNENVGTLPDGTTPSPSGSIRSEARVSSEASAQQDSDKTSLGSTSSYVSARESLTSESDAARNPSGNGASSSHASSESVGSSGTAGPVDRATLTQVTSREQLNALQMERRVIGMTEPKTQPMPGAWVSDVGE